MRRASRFIGGVLACWAAAGAAGLPSVQAQDRQERREERREERRDRVQERRAVPVQERERTTTEVREREDAPPADARGGRSLKAKSVLGSKVSIRGDLVISTVDDIIFNDDGYVDYLVV